MPAPVSPSSALSPLGQNRRPGVVRGLGVERSFFKRSSTASTSARLVTGAPLTAYFDPRSARTLDASPSFDLPSVPPDALKGRGSPTKG